MRFTRKRFMRKRHTKRNKKYGGTETVFVCKDGRTSNELCIADFEDAKGFIWQDVPPDGNCFFHALELYYSLTYPDNHDNKSHEELRKIVVDFIKTNFEEYKIYGMTQKGVIALSKNGGWNNLAGDFVIPAAAPALNIKIKLYDVKSGNKERKEKKRIILYTYPEVNGNNGIEREEVNLIRINDNHFGLLIPSAPAPRNQFKELQAKVKELQNRTRKNSNKKSNQFEELKTKIKEMRNMYGNEDPK